MSNVLICFGGAAYDRVIEKTGSFLFDRKTYNRFVDELKVYDDRWLLDSDFYRLNKAWWDKPDTKYNLPNRGFGWFIWKPYVIMNALASCQPGDVVLYIDADTYPIADLSPIFDIARRDGIMLFEAQGCHHANWCKRDTFIVMGQDEERWRNRKHACARFSAWSAGDALANQILTEWQAYCLNPLVNTFDVSVLAPEHPELREPRCEQAILTNLAHKYGVKLYREACQAGVSQPEDKGLYGQLFVQDDGLVGDKTDLSGSKWRNV